MEANEDDDDEGELETPAMTPQDVAAARQQLSATGALLTHRLRVYFVPSDCAPELLAGCANFNGLSELQRLRLLRELLPTGMTSSEPPRQQEEEQQQRTLVDASSSRLMRCLSRHRLLGQMTQRLEPIGRLRSCCRGQCEQSLMQLLEESGASCSAAAGVERELAEVARRHLRRLQTRQPLVPEGGNEQPFPLAGGLSPESLRLELHQQQEGAPRWVDVCTGECDNCHDTKVADVTPASGSNRLTTITDAELYRPYLNTWTPLEVQSTDASDHPVQDDEDDDNKRAQDHRLLLADRQQRLMAVVGALTWRQKQHRQQRLAVRLATRSALIGLKHSISVEPAKNYLELYVNMISRAVEHTSGHVRRWSHSLEHSWKAFKELASTAAAAAAAPVG